MKALGLLQNKEQMYASTPHHTQTSHTNSKRLHIPPNPFTSVLVLSFCTTNYQKTSGFKQQPCSPSLCLWVRAQARHPWLMSSGSSQAVGRALLLWFRTEVLVFLLAVGWDISQLLEDPHVPAMDPLSPS